MIRFLFSSLHSIFAHSSSFVHSVPNKNGCGKSWAHLKLSKIQGGFYQAIWKLDMFSKTYMNPIKWQVSCHAL